MSSKSFQHDTSSEVNEFTFHPTLWRWFKNNFEGTTPAQSLAWPTIADGRNTLLLAPTGSGKTLAAFLNAIDRIMFTERPANTDGVRVLYISPLKALGVDVERNLRVPLAGIRELADLEKIPYHVPTIGVRSGDTPSSERLRLNKKPPDILITTPESVYLLLTARSREILRNVETVIVDEIHSLVGNKRGAHLFLSLERLEQLRSSEGGIHEPIQRIGLSATQRPLAEIAALLGGADATSDSEKSPILRPVEIIEAGRSKPLDLKIEVPVEDMANLSAAEVGSGASKKTSPGIPSIWPSIHPRLVELIRSHQTTMIFVNNRRLAERLAGAINDLATEEIALAHHGSLAKETRAHIENQLKSGRLPAIIATSSLELGIDMGSVDLVIQIEAPPSIASGMQRIGRAGHQVGVKSKGIIFPKFRGDLLACSAAVSRMYAGDVEETYFPRNPLDVLAQQIVAIVSLATVSADELYALVRGAAPFFDLPRTSFEGVLDLLSGRYPSHEFSELRPRITWDRINGRIRSRKGAQRLAILNAGTIPDRGLYGVFLQSDGNGNSCRVGELDEEMVFETKAGDVFRLGASSWRVTDITNDRLLVTPAPGEPGRMPFWRGDKPGRPYEFGRAIGQLTRMLLDMPDEAAERHLMAQHALDERASRNLVKYLRDQKEATTEVPSDKTIGVEYFRDEVGDWRVCILSPFGSRIHSPWATAVSGRLAKTATGQVDLVWNDDGIMFRLPDSDQPPAPELLFPSSEEIEKEVVNQLGSTALFAARFRENAARALLLPRRQPGRRTPLWLQRRRAADLLSVASKYADFPIILETYRECLRDVFDIRGLTNLLQQVERKEITVNVVKTHGPSPFAATFLFNYVGNFIYDGDAPLAERRAATLALDHVQLRELLGDAELRKLLDRKTIEQFGLELQKLKRSYPITDADGIHDLLLQLGDLGCDEISQRVGSPMSSSLANGQFSMNVQRADDEVHSWIEELTAQGRIIQIQIRDDVRLIAAEDASRYRDALGTTLPDGIAEAFLDSVNQPDLDLVARYAKTHVPFTVDDVARRLVLDSERTKSILAELVLQNRLAEGEFTPGGRAREWCDVEVLRVLKRRSLEKLRRQVEPVDPSMLARFLPRWHGIEHPRKGLDGLLDVIEQLQGVALPASDLEDYVLPARISDYRTSDLDELCAAGEIVWRGIDRLGAEDGRIALYLTEHFDNLSPPAEAVEGELADAIRSSFRSRGALFFDDLASLIGGFRNDLFDTLWDLFWAGEVTNDTLAPLRSLRRKGNPITKRKSRSSSRRIRSRRIARTPGTEGRWSLLRSTVHPSNTQRQMALATQLVERYGVLTPEMVMAEGISGGFSGIYPILKAMEDIGRVRRGFFVAGLGATQFALPGADDRLRSMDSHDPAGFMLPDLHDDEPDILVLAANDPANAFGSALKWPDRTSEETMRPGRVAGSRVILLDGHLIGYLAKKSEHLLTFLPHDEPARSQVIQKLAHVLGNLATSESPVYLTKIDGRLSVDSPLVESLLSAGFVASSKGLLLRRI